MTTAPPVGASGKTKKKRTPCGVRFFLAAPVRLELDAATLPRQSRQIYLDGLNNRHFADGESEKCCQAAVSVHDRWMSGDARR